MRYCSCLLISASLSTASLAQVQNIYSLADMPNHGYLNVDRPPDCNFPIPSFTISAAGHDVVLTTMRGSDQGQPYFFGCFQWDGVFPTRQLPVDPNVNPGDFRGLYGSAPSYSDVILDFSEPLTGFGICSLQERVVNTNLSDTIVVFDGPHGTGNALATVITPTIESGKLGIVFIGAIASAPIIRSARVLQDGKFYIDGFAVGVAPCPADFNHDAGLDFFDYLDFVDAFSNQDPAADFNHDGGIDFFDYLDFVDVFSAGC